MSWMIRDQSELESTCYIELLPGKYEGTSWNEESVFFDEECFGFIERKIVRHCPKYDHYSFTDINRSTWEFILADLNRDAYPTITDWTFRVRKISLSRTE